MFKKVKRISKEWGIKLFNACFNRPQGTILMLHRIGEWDAERLECVEELKVTPERLQRYVDQYKDTHDFVTLDYVVDCMEGRIQPKRPYICITFDDGFRDNLIVGLPFFEKNNIPFTIFVTADFVTRKPAFNYPFILERMIWNNKHMVVNGVTYDCKTRQRKNEVFRQLKRLVQNIPYDNFEMTYRELFKGYLLPEYEEDLLMTWDEIRQLAASPLCTIGSHTMTHCRLANVPHDKLPYELAESKRQIEQEVGKEVKYISYPFGWITDVNENVLAATQVAGYEMGLISWGGPIRKKDHNMFVVKRQMLMENE